MEVGRVTENISKSCFFWFQQADPDAKQGTAKGDVPEFVNPLNYIWTVCTERAVPVRDLDVFFTKVQLICSCFALG